MKTPADVIAALRSQGLYAAKAACYGEDAFVVASEVVLVEPGVGVLKDMVVVSPEGPGWAVTALHGATPVVRRFPSLREAAEAAVGTVQADAERRRRRGD